MRKKTQRLTNTLVTDEYADLLDREMVGIKKSALEAACGRSRQTLWRAVSERKVDAAFALRNAINKVRGIMLPPPAVAIRDSTDYRWIAAGLALRDRNAATFERALEDVETLLGVQQTIAKLTVLTASQRQEKADTRAAEDDDRRGGGDEVVGGARRRRPSPERPKIR